MVNLDLPPIDSVEVRRHWKSIAPTAFQHDFDMLETEEVDIEHNKTVRNKVPRLTATKSILCLNREVSVSERKSFLNDKFKLIGADLRNILKSKIDGELKMHNLSHCK